MRKNADYRLLFRLHITHTNEVPTELTIKKALRCISGKQDGSRNYRNYRVTVYYMFVIVLNKNISYRGLPTKRDFAERK